MEEAGIRLIKPKVKGIVNVNGFASKIIINFVVVGTTNNPVKSSLEGELKWVNIRDIPLKVFGDTMPMLEKIMSMKGSEIFVGTTKYRGLSLLDVNLRVV